MAVDCVEFQPVDHLNRLNHMFHISTHEFNVSSSYKQPVSQARTGHARFRRSPSSVSSSPESNGPSTSSQSVNETTSSSSSRSTNSFSSMTSSLAGGGLDGSVSNGKQFSSSLGIVAPSLTFSSKKPPLPSTHRKRCIAERPVANVHGSGNHFCKRRKIGSKREVRRVPIIGSKVTSIPADDYSWKKYGEKRIEGSPYPRVYYKCSTGKGCPARKLVELAKDDSKMLLVTYDGEHRHRVAPTPVPTGLTGLVVQSK